MERCTAKQTLVYVFVLLLLFIVFPTALTIKSNPYQTLGVKRTSTIQDIKRAYKHSVKEWHPDKNKDPGAEQKFIEINEAYALLSDPERRREYDLHGITEDAPHMRQKPDYSQYRRFDPFDSLFGNDPFQFNFNFNEGSIFHKYTITHRAYESAILGKSMRQPYLILFYSDWCLPCMQLEPLWKRIVEEIEPIGMGVATVHAEHEKLLTKKLGVSGLPYLVMVMDGRVMHYREPQINVNKVVEFTKRKFPFRTVVTINENTVEAFLNSWGSDNKVRVLFFGRQENIRLRYYLVAFHHRDRVVAGYVWLGAPQTESIRNRYGVSLTSESLLVFNENLDTPIASLSMADIPTPTMHDVINANKFLILPRLSSQSMFDQLCPPEASRSRKRLCVVLVTRNWVEHETYRDAMREYIQNFAPKTDRVHFAYIYQEKQTNFLHALSQSGSSPETPTLHVVIIWRIDLKNLKYEWLKSDWNIEADKINSTQEILRSTLHRLLHSNEVLTYDAVIQELVDEHAQSIFMRILMKMFLLAEFLQENLSREEALPVISILCTIAFIAGGGYVMSYLVKLEEESVRQRLEKEGKPYPFNQFNGSTEGGFCRTASIPVQLRVHELKGETYNALIRLLKPGCRTIVLLVDGDSKTKLLPKFQKVVNPYRKNKTLMFSFLMLEKHLEWYKRLLIQTLPEPRELNVNPKNCIGTVLSLNGLRRYFCMYHAKHNETYRGGQDSQGGFMGLEDSSDSEPDLEAGAQTDANAPSVIPVDNLLDGLPNWLDRLFEGTTQRYYIQFWPMMK